MKEVNETLSEREKTYGSFRGYSLILSKLNSSIDVDRASLNHVHNAALDMILSKIARILNGDPDHADSWHDIAGYAKLVEKEITKGA